MSDERSKTWTLLFEPLLRRLRPRRFLGGDGVEPGFLRGSLLSFGLRLGRRGGSNRFLGFGLFDSLLMHYCCWIRVQANA